MPTVEQLIAGYEELIQRARAAGLDVILATVTALAPELLGGTDPDREGIRAALNTWIRSAGNEVLDFDAAIRANTEPTRLEAKYAAPDDTHPNIDGEKRLASVAVDALTRIILP